MFVLPTMRHSQLRLLTLITILLLSGAAQASPPSGAVVLMYHHFGEARYPTTNVSLQQFDAHLSYLAQNRFEVWPLEEIIAQLKAAKPLPSRVVAITIDDAYRSIYDHAYPRLKARGWPFTVFVSTDAVDKKMPAFMSWDQMREMQGHGASFANHSSRHDYLITQQKGEPFSAWQQRIRTDLQHAQQRLQQELERALPLFAYPYGEYNPALQQIIKEFGWTAFGQQSGVVSQYSDRLALPRYPMAEQFADLGQFETKVMSLPLPVLSAAPVDPIIDRQNPPRLQLTVAQHQDIQLDQLNCFASNQGAAKVTWINRKRGQLTVEAHKPFGSRRSRYNCTAPSRASGRYYWYSHPWIRTSVEHD